MLQEVIRAGLVVEGEWERDVPMVELTVLALQVADETGGVLTDGTPEARFRCCLEGRWRASWVSGG